jgi:hypothetical protein
MVSMPLLMHRWQYYCSESTVVASVIMIVTMVVQASSGLPGVSRIISRLYVTPAMDPVQCLTGFLHYFIPGLLVYSPIHDAKRSVLN